MQGQVFLMLRVLAVVVTAMAVVGTVLIVRVIVAVSHVFRGDLEGVKIMAPVLLMIRRMIPLIARMMMVCLRMHPLVPVVILSRTILPVLVSVADAPPFSSFLPSFNMMCAPNFRWGDVPGESFVHNVTCCYDEVVHWRKVLFRIPLAKCGRAFVAEQARLFRAYATGSALESIALKAAMIMPVLLLQRPHVKSKEKDHATHLTRRLSLWSRGDIHSLVSEGRTLQSIFSKSRRNKPFSDASSVARRFSQLMMSGKVKAALRLLSSDCDGKVLPFSSDVMESLVKKHPKKRPPVSSTLVDDSAVSPHFILFDQLDAVRVRRVALKLHGAAGPSGLDASAWRRMCTSFRQSQMTYVMLCQLLPGVYAPLLWIPLVYHPLLPVA